MTCHKLSVATVDLALVGFDMKYLVLYARIVDDKEIGALMTGIFVGGVCDNEAAADELATRCVSETQGGIIIPKVVKMHSDLMEMVAELEDYFGKLADRMYETEQILNRNRRRL